MRIVSLIFLLSGLLLLNACTGITSKSRVKAPAVTTLDAEESSGQAEDYTQSGKFLDAALLYIKLAGESDEPEKQHYQLQAVDVMLDGLYLVQAEQLLSDIQVAHLDTSYQNRKTLLSARIALARNLPDKTLAILAPLQEQSLTPELQKRLLTIKADAFAKTGNILEAARERVLLESLLEDEDERRVNQTAILSALARLSELALQQLITEPPPDALSGWLELSLMTRRLEQQPDVMDNELKQWRLRYPAHTALDEVLRDMMQREKIEILQPTQIALLLPSRNQFAKAADAIKKGLLSTYFAQSSGDDSAAQRPVLRIYDTDSETENFWTVYNKAVADGAQFIIGPLDKALVTMLNEKSSLEVPTLALNYSEKKDKTTRNLFQFGLSPEDEAAQVAERAWLNGYSSALVLVPQGNWGERVYTSFMTRWEQLGGSVAEYQTYDSKKNDFSPSIRKVLNIDESERRHSQLHATLNHRTFFTPRRRHDVDFIFIGAFPRQARQLRPQFKFHHAADLPVFGTSHIYSGKINRQMDRDMNGVFFGDMPWVIPNMTANESLKKDINRLWPNISERYARLFALGIDAYNLIPSLNRLQEYRAEYHKGETGNLYLDDSNRIHRRLLWLGFDKGVPFVIDNLN